MPEPAIFSPEQVELKARSRRSDSELHRDRRRLELALEKKEYDDTYQTCCTKSGRTDRRLLEWAFTSTVSLVVISFSMYKLATAADCDALIPFWSSLITYILGSMGLTSKRRPLKPSTPTSP